jgi:carbon storage regulator
VEKWPSNFAVLWPVVCIRFGVLRSLLLSRKEILMLILSRKIGEQIVIDGHILVTVSAIKGNQVRIGITAPRGIRVDRAEIHRRVLNFAETEDVSADRHEHAGTI